MLTDYGKWLYIGLASECARSGTSQMDIARLLTTRQRKVDDRAVRKILQEQGKMTVADMFKIADNFFPGVSLNYLFEIRKDD